MVCSHKFLSLWYHALPPEKSKKEKDCALRHCQIPAHPHTLLLLVFNLGT